MEWQLKKEATITNIYDNYQLLKWLAVVIVDHPALPT